MVSNLMKKHLVIKIYGKVQGVSFRYCTKEKAHELDIFGFVYNKSDGTVYIEAEGEENSLKKFLKWCQKGPETAKIEKVDFVCAEKLKNFGKFQIV